MRIYVLAGIALLIASSAMAQDVSVRAYLSSQEVGLNRQFVLNVEVTGTQQIESGPDVPDISAFARYLGSGTSSSMQSINGRVSVSVTVQYRFQATKLGTFEIGPVTVRAGGKQLQTHPVTVTVTASPSTAAGAAPGGDVVEIPADDLFLVATPSKRRVLVNEPVVVEYRIFTRVDVNSYSITDLPATPGFWVEELDVPSPPQVERLTRDGKEYVSAVIRRAALFPTSAGRKTLAPLSVEAQVRVNRRSRDPFGDIFSRGFGSRIPVVIATDSVAIDVLPLPTGDQPNAFTGFVGALDLSASIDMTDVATNEALTFRLRVSGEGNLQTLPDPNIAFPGDFEVYPPEISQQLNRSGNGIRGVKTYEYVLIPRSPGTHTIPSVTYHYYDLARSDYATAATARIDVRVTGDVAEGPTIGGRGRRAVEPLREDIRFIHVSEPPFSRRDAPLFDHSMFWIIFLAPLAMLAGAAGVRRHRDRLAGDVRYARDRRAARLAKRRLARARSLRDPEQAKAFHAEVSRALQGFLGDKLNVAEAGMIRDQIRTALTMRGVPAETSESYFACVDECDRYRFAPADVTTGIMDTLLTRAEEAMTTLDRTLR